MRWLNERWVVFILLEILSNSTQVVMHLNNERPLENPFNLLRKAWTSPLTKQMRNVSIRVSIKIYRTAFWFILSIALSQTCDRTIVNRHSGWMWNKSTRSFSLLRFGFQFCDRSCIDGFQVVLLVFRGARSFSLSCRSSLVVSSRVKRFLTFLIRFYILCSF